MSYGARLALTVMRDRPEGLRAVILDGVYPPQINRYEDTPAGFIAAVDTLLADVRAPMPSAASSTPTSRSRSGAARPRRRDAPHGDGEEPRRRLPPHAPAERRRPDRRAVRRVLRRRTRAGAAVRDRSARRGRCGGGSPSRAAEHRRCRPRQSRGSALSVDCAEEAPFNDDERIAAALADNDPILAHYALLRRIPRGLRAVGVPALPETENAPVTSAIPTLLTTGGYDPVHPDRIRRVHR